MTHINVRSGARTWRIDNDPKLPLLDQLLATGAPISFSCRRGDCGQCAVRLLEGEITPVDARRPLWQDEKLLSCNASVPAALAVEIPYDEELEGIQVLRSPAKIHGLERLSPDVMELTLRLPPANEIRFLPGQYVRLTNREGSMRSYSLSAGPAADRMLRMHIARVAEGVFSSWLFERAAMNELLHVEGPQGRFFLRARRRVAQSIFLATGTGIAPIHAMLASCGEEARERLGEVFIYWGNRSQADAYLLEPLQTLAERRRFHMKAIVSREPDGRPVAARPHVQHHMAAEHPSLRDAQVFACGNPGMVEAARAAAQAAGLPAEHFHSDPFTAS